METMMALPPVTPATLIVALSTIPQDCTLVKNEVGNLAILGADGGYFGFVDLQTGLVQPWGDDDDVYEPDPNLLPPKVLQLRGANNEVLWEGPTPLAGLTGIVGTVCTVTDANGALVYRLPSMVVMHADETLTFGPASSGEVTFEVTRLPRPT